MPNLGPTELIIILVIVLIIFGSSRLPGLFRASDKESENSATRRKTPPQRKNPRNRPTRPSRPKSDAEWSGAAGRRCVSTIYAAWSARMPMNSRTRIRPAWPGWLVWALPAGIGLIVIGYLLIYQSANISARPAGVFWGEVLVFGIIGPVVAWLLLRQLALASRVSHAAAVQIEALTAEERHRRARDDRFVRRLGGDEPGAERGRCAGRRSGTRAGCA